MTIKPEPNPPTLKEKIDKVINEMLQRALEVNGLTPVMPRMAFGREVVRGQAVPVPPPLPMQFLTPQTHFEFSDGTKVVFDPNMPSGGVLGVGSTNAEGVTDVVLHRDGYTCTAKVKLAIDDAEFMREVRRRFFSNLCGDCGADLAQQNHFATCDWYEADLEDDDTCLYIATIGGASLPLAHVLDVADDRHRTAACGERLPRAESCMFGVLPDMMRVCEDCLRSEAEGGVE